MSFTRRELRAVCFRVFRFRDFMISYSLFRGFVVSRFVDFVVSWFCFVISFHDFMISWFQNLGISWFRDFVVRDFSRIGRVVKTTKDFMVFEVFQFRVQMLNPGPCTRESGKILRIVETSPCNCKNVRIRAHAGYKYKLFHQW